MKDKNNVQAIEKTEKLIFRYMCEGCTNVAIYTTNKMVGVEIDCTNCHKRQVTLASNYISV